MNPSPTPYPDLNQVLQALVGNLQGVLQDNLVGVYLQGSFAVGDFDLHSDVDWIIVIENEISDQTVAALQEMHAQLYELESHWAQHLEGSYFPKDLFQDLTPSDQDLWFLDNGANQLKPSDHCNTLVTRWTVLQHGIPLVGPPPDTLLDPISTEALKQEIYEDLIQWGQQILDDQDRYNNRFYQGFITLSYCRMLHSLDEGMVGSKRAGAAWAKTNLDPKYHALIDRAWDTRADLATSVRTPADPTDFALTIEFLRYTMEKSKEYMEEAS